MAETHALFAAAIEAVGSKKVAQVLGLSRSHVYRLARHPMDDGDPEGTGARNDLDRIELLLEVMASRPHAKPALIRFRLWFDDLFRRLIDREPVGSLEDTAAAAGKLCREFAELVGQVRPGFDPAAIAKEGAELIALVERVVRAAQAAEAVTAGS